VPSRLPGRLNLFQAAMLEWRDQHPYNAVHAARVTRALDRAALAAAIDAELVESGLTGLVLDRARGRYAWRGGAPSAPLDVVEAADGWERAIAQAIERHLNLPFTREGAIDPFRFFAVPDGDGFFLALAYDHFIAGGDSIVALLEAIAARYLGARDHATLLRRYPPTHARLFARHPLAFLRGFASFPALAASCRRTIRPRYRDIGDGYNGFLLFTLDPHDYHALRGAAKKWGVTVNDALMALLLVAQDAAMPARDPRKRRHELAVASIVNLRSAHGDDAHDTFGQYLGSFRVSHPVPRNSALSAIAADVHRATDRVKHERLYLATLFAMAVDRQLGRLQSPKQRMGIYAKNYPVGAGVSSLDVDSLWRDATSKPPLYVRGVPTGPLSPLVAAVTTCAGRMCIGLSFRPTAISREDANALGRDLVSRIRTLAHESSN
ncbi:MAG TPA: hypothetical protein VG865_03655, partial [Casimicrobiaceae bacterium]|nr:hypothetical protein [Casimicrobiaceae bacterium]